MCEISVLILTQDNCAFCESAKDLFRDLARDFPLSVVILDMNSVEGQELALRAGMPFPPCIFINGEPFCYGRPSERKIRRELESLEAGLT